MRLPCTMAALLLPAFLWADGPPTQKVTDAGKTFTIPYLFSDSGHLVVRVKIDGKGPFNFIVDTGAPEIYVATEVAKKIGIWHDKKADPDSLKKKSDKKKFDLTILDKIQVEGGPVHTKMGCVIDTPYQLVGMNALGLPGVELHGILGYAFLSQYKMEIDLTKDSMKWTRLAFTPPPPQPLGLKGDELDGMDGILKFIKMYAALMGNKKMPEPVFRGYVGIELGDKDGGAVLTDVTANSPAAASGLKTGDRIIGYKTTMPTEAKAKAKEIEKIVLAAAEIRELFAALPPGHDVRLYVLRGNATKEIKLKTGEGL